MFTALLGVPVVQVVRAGRVVRMAVAVAAQLVILVMGVTVALGEVLKEQAPVHRATVAQVVVARPMVEEVALGF